MEVQSQALSNAAADAVLDSALQEVETSPAPSSPDTGGTGLTQPGLPPTGDGGDASQKEQKKLSAEEKKALKEQEKLNKAQEKLLGEQEAKRVRDEEEKRRQREQSLIGLGERLLSSGKEKGAQATTVIANLPTPGQIAFPLMLLILFFFGLVTYNGKTRFQWGWDVLTNNAYVSDSSGSPSGQQQQQNSSGGTGGGAPPSPPVLVPVSKNGMGSPY